MSVGRNPCQKQEHKDSGVEASESSLDVHAPGSTSLRVKDGVG